MMPRITVRGVQDGTTSYSFHVAEVIRGLVTTGWDPSLFSRNLNVDLAPPDILERVVRKPQQEPYELIVDTPSAPVSVGKKAGQITMYETTRAPEDFIEILNSREFVIVPSHWNLCTLSAQGVTVPLYVVPMGIHPERFPWTPLPKTAKTVFASAGCKHGYYKEDDQGFDFTQFDDRKNFAAVVKAFQTAFPTGAENVELRIKMYPHQHNDRFHQIDPRITVIEEFWEPQQVAQFYQGCHALVCGTRGEGWGLMQQEAMASGRIVIAANFAGMTEFYGDAYGLPVRWSTAPGSGSYAGQGLWCEPDVDHMAHQMLAVHNDWDGYDRPNMSKLGMSASARAGQFTWAKTWDEIDSILRDHGFDGRGGNA